MLIQSNILSILPQNTNVHKVAVHVNEQNTESNIQHAEIVLSYRTPNQQHVELFRGLTEHCTMQYLNIH